ncbi:hypothetical protein ACN38_g10533 [Penicillium nordicum]|uniref:Uncharacterized protein n=1 Tax=Penicillium nordicum TaxID=229535 RepID=A0A0M8NWA8_9EURO|nr:hypothetical protein ACN38_g10533 [Penicillium nordicum]
MVASSPRSTGLPTRSSLVYYVRQSADSRSVNEGRIDDVYEVTAYGYQSILDKARRGVSKCKVAYIDLQGIIPWRSCDFQYWIYHILRLVIITAQIVEIAGFVILES